MSASNQDRARGSAAGPAEMGPGTIGAPVAHVWEIVLAMGAVGGFAEALARAVHHGSYDLRTPALLLLDVAIAAGFAVGYAVAGDAPARRTRLLWCLLYGLWAAALFSLVDTHTNEQVLWNVRFMSPDVPSISLFGVLHGGLVLLLSWPFARRALGQETGAKLSESESAQRMLGVTVLAFFLVAAGVRVLAG